MEIVAAQAMPSGQDDRPDAVTDARVLDAAREFEAFFLAQVLRDLGSGLSGEGPLGGAEGDPWRSMLTDAYARLIARAGGIGLADVVVRELVRAQEMP